MLKNLWKRLAGVAGGSAGAEPGPATEYNGYRIRPEPYAEGGQYQTAVTIEKDFGTGVKTHRFVRAEKHASREEAVAFAVTKGKQIIDERGDRLFD